MKLHALGRDLVSTYINLCLMIALIFLYNMSSLNLLLLSTIKALTGLTVAEYFRDEEQ